jgi:hypothetical protein
MLGRDNQDTAKAKVCYNKRVMKMHFAMSAFAVAAICAVSIHAASCNAKERF